MSNSPNSPCTGGCTLGNHGYCVRCFRTANEIMHWAEMPRFARQLARKYAKKRRAAHADPHPVPSA